MSTTIRINTLKAGDKLTIRAEFNQLVTANQSDILILAISGLGRLYRRLIAGNTITFSLVRPAPFQADDWKACVALIKEYFGEKCRIIDEGAADQALAM
ncbi:MAG TPA: hypothetical protein VFZ58_05135 [Candidatus Saccharimonadales bacterium]